MTWTTPFISHLGLTAKSRARKDRDPGGEKDFILESAAIQRGMRPIGNIISDVDRVSFRRANERVSPMIG